MEYWKNEKLFAFMTFPCSPEPCPRTIELIKLTSLQNQNASIEQVNTPQKKTCYSLILHDGRQFARAFELYSDEPPTKLHRHFFLIIPQLYNIAPAHVRNQKVKPNHLNLPGAIPPALSYPARRLSVHWRCNCSVLDDPYDGDDAASLPQYGHAWFGWGFLFYVSHYMLLLLLYASMPVWLRAVWGFCRNLAPVCITRAQDLIRSAASLLNVTQGGWTWCTV